MEEKKGQQKKVQSIQINSFTSKETLLKQLDVKQQYDEFQLTLLNSSSISSYISQTIYYLNQYENIPSIEINLKNLSNFDLKYISLLNQLKEQTQISQISINITALHCNFSQQCRLGDCLQNLTNLKILKLSVLSSNISIKSEYFNFCETYKNLSQLQNLEISFLEQDKYQPLITCLMDGIRYLKNLEEFSLQVQYKSTQAGSNLIGCLDEEISQLEKIKGITIIFDQVVIGQYDISRFQQMLHNSKSLEKLKIQLPNLSTQKQITTSQIKDSFIELPTQLKTLHLKYAYQSDEPFIQFFSFIQKLPNLENTILDLEFKNRYSSDEFLIQLGTFLASIPFLKDLKIEFKERFTIQDMFKFIGQFNVQKQLKQLQINFSQKNSILKADNEQLQNEDFQQVIDVIRGLSSFKLIIDEAWVNYDQYCSNQVMEIVGNSENIKELQLTFQNANYSSSLDFECKDLINKMKNLSHLDLEISRNYKISTLNFCNLFSNFQQTPLLQVIKLKFEGRHTIEYLFFQRFKEEVFNLKQLKELSFVFDKDITIEKEGILYLGQAISSLNNLEDLTIQLTSDFNASDELKNFGSSFQSLFNLKKLDLDLYCEKSLSSQLEQIQFIHQLILPCNLEKLDLNIQLSSLQFIHYTDLFKGISSLTYLQELSLKLSQMEINLNDCVFLNDLLSNLKNAIVIHLNFFHHCMFNLAPLFQNCPSLKSLYFILDYQYGVFKEAGFYRQSNIAILDQNSNQIVNNQDEQFSSIHLVLKNIRLQSQSIENIFLNCQILTHLELIMSTNNRFDEEGALMLFKNISYLQHLKYLNLTIQQGNRIGNNSIIELGKVISQLKQLQNLVLDIDSTFNDIDWERACYFLEGIRNLQSLQSFKLSLQNQHPNEQIDLTNIFLHLSQINSLEHFSLSLKNNTVFKIEDFTFVQFLQSKCGNLKQLELYINIHHDETLQYLRQFYRNLKILQNLLSIKLLVKNKHLKRSILKLKKLVSVDFTEQYGNQNYLI